MSGIICIWLDDELYFLALKNRRNVRLHAGYMLTTPLIPFKSPFSRIILSDMPFLVLTDSEFPQRIVDAIVLAMVISVAFALVVYFRDRKYGIPFLLAAIFLLVESVSMYVGTGIEWVRQGFEAYARIPTAPTLVIGFLLGAAISWFGWASFDQRRGQQAEAALSR